MIELPFAVYSDLKHSFHQIQREINELKEMLAIRSRERLSREKKYQLAAARLERVLIRHAKAGFRPDQPRVPVGSRSGGQWTSETGEQQQVMSDAVPDAVVPGAQYAQTQFNIDPSALTGISTIDDTTKQLANTLARIKDTFEYTPNLNPRKYGVAIHAAFAKAVRAQGLPGIAPSDVETTFGGDRYGAKGSVRTDVILRNDVGDVVAIYDVKTGEKGIEPKRAAELRLKAGVGNEVPIIQMSFPYGLSRKNAILGGSFIVQTF